MQHQEETSNSFDYFGISAYDLAMENYEQTTTFNADVAGRYDNRLRGDEKETVDFLQQMAGNGRALELAIGTGRIGIPLSQRGIHVDGIELSPDMAARLQAKTGAEKIKVTIGDMAEVAVEGKYELIYLVYNTLPNLMTQEAQVRCFENVARHLTDDGVFVIELGVPTYLCRLRDNQYVDLEIVEVDRVGFDVAKYDPVEQVLEESHISFSRDEGMRMSPLVTRYVWPSELDLMARIAGLKRQERYANWNRQPFTAESRTNISVYSR